MTFDFSTNNVLRIEHLRYKRVWLALGLLMVALVTLASVVRVPAPVHGLLVHDKLIHLAVYACLMGWFAQIFRNDLARLVFVVLLSGLGVAIEFIQAATPSREFEVFDMLANTCGVLLAWALGYTWVGTILWRVEKLFLNDSALEFPK